MADVPAFLGEWNFQNTITAPPATGQIRLNNATQKNATLMFVSEATANSMDAVAFLTSITQDHLVRLRDKDDAAKWQSFLITGVPIDRGVYVEYPVTWQAGGTNLATQRINLDVLTAHTVIPVTGFRLGIKTNEVDIEGQLVSFDFAYPHTGTKYTTPGLTIRQYYAAQAMMGFISASNVSAAQLAGKVAAYAFTAADSMIAYEEKERAGYQMPPAGSDRNSPATPAPIPELEQQSVQGRGVQQVQAAFSPTPPSPSPSPTLKTVWPRKIIS